MKRQLARPESQFGVHDVQAIPHHRAKTNPATLMNLIRSAKMIVLSPLATGAYQTQILISTGQYSSAIKCAFVSVACFLILAISTSLFDIGLRLIDLKGNRKIEPQSKAM
jgi:uncharacterized membrane protein YcjF (UPF0283 family)